MWLEGRIYLEYLRLIRDPVFRGVDIPPGLGKPVMLIPGFLAGDWTLHTPFQWLRRVGYRPQVAGVTFNVMYSEVMLRPLIDTLRELRRKTGAKVSVVGHSRGGVLAKVLSHRKPDLVEQVITLGSPLNDPFDIHPLTMAGVRAAHLYNVFRYGHPASVEERFLRDLAAAAAGPDDIGLFALRRRRQLEGVPATRCERNRGAGQPHRTRDEPGCLPDPGLPAACALAGELTG